ncbi:MAG: HAMP domain-containing histidine kinase [Oscillospiraceae bacterium]|nr:HAMP domain-containing histidine kinase [Oscillospiraceae bacterium]
MGWIAAIVSLAAAVVLAVRLMTLKKALREIKRELVLNRENGYNRQITVPLADRDLEEAAAEINRGLDFQKKLKSDTEKKERLLKQSVSDIAHDLRTPLAVIKGNLQLMECDENLSENGEKYLRICSSRADSMKQMADDFFELAVLESESTSADIKKVNLTNAMMQFIADNEAVIRNSGLEPEVVFPEKSVFVCADEIILQRMLGNLLNNILRYAQESFRLSLGDDGSVCFSNTVKGVPPDTERLFERSYRSGKAADGQGAGLGLYIVRLLAEKQSAETKAAMNGNVLELSIKFRQE